MTPEQESRLAPLLERMLDIERLREPWLDKHQFAEHLSSSPRWVVAREEEGMPSAMIAGKLKFKVSEAEPWLQEHGHINRRNDG